MPNMLTSQSDNHPAGPLLVEVAVRRPGYERMWDVLSGKDQTLIAPERLALSIQRLPLADFVSCGAPRRDKGGGLRSSVECEIELARFRVRRRERVERGRVFPLRGRDRVSRQGHRFLSVA